MKRFNVIVTLKPALLDAQGRTVMDALHALGYSGVTAVRVGKVFELELSGQDEASVREMCDRLLANPVIEDYTIEPSP